MARLFIEGWEHGLAWASPFWDNSGNLSVNGVGTTGFTGTYYGEPYMAHSSYRSFTPVSEVYGSMKVSQTNNSSKLAICSFKDSDGTVIACLAKLATTNTICLYRGNDAGTVLETSTAVLVLNQVHLLEFWYKPLNSDGRFIVKLDGVQVINFDDAGGDSTAGLENVAKFGIGVTSNSSGSCRVDDIVLDDAGWIGNSYIQLVKPTAVGDTAAVWDPSTGACWSCIDEVPYSDTDYISTDTTSEVDTYNCNDLAGTIGSVKSMRVVMRYAYEGSPTPTKQKIAIKSGGNLYYGDDLTPALTFQFAEKLWELNPDDDAAWEDADIDDLEIGVASVE